MKADRKLDELGFKYEEVVQDEATKSCDDAARERGLETRQIVKSLIVESEGERFHVLLPGDRELSERKFGSEYRMIPPEESREITGFESGTVHPFSTELDHVVDERVFENDRVSHTVGEKRRGVIIDSTEFREAIESSDFPVEIRDIAVSTEEDYREVEEEGLDAEDARFVVNKGYRKIFLGLIEDKDSETVLDLLRAFHREEIEPKRDIAVEMLERSDSTTHMQRMIESYAEDGILPEKEEFDLDQVISDVLESHPGAVDDFRDGKDSAVNFLIGQIMKQTNGKADAGETRQELLERLK